MATRVHLEVAQDPIDVKAGERQDLWYLTLLAQLLFQEENFAFPSAYMTVSGDDVAPLIHHEAGFVDVDVPALFVFAEEELDFAITVPIEHTHDLLQLERLAVVVVELGHQTTEGLELSVVKALDAIFVNNAALFIDQETLHGHKSTEFVDKSGASLPLVETERVLFIFIEERAKQVEGVEIVLLQGVGHGDVAAFIEFAPRENLGLRSIVIDVSSLLVD